MIKFGRFSDAYKPKSKLEKWNECEKLYNDKKFFESYSEFFEYLRDTEFENVFHSLDSKLLTFQVLQGSKEIRGYSDGNKVSALVLIAEYEKLTVPVMRRLMEMNYSLYYSRFAIKDNKIVLKFDSSILDCSPRKLYYALKEIAIRADKLDDILLYDFSTLKPFDTHQIEYTDEEKDIRIKYFRQWINDAITFVSGLKRDDFSGAISYIYLNLIYRIDYLLQPRGPEVNELEKMNWKYFNSKDTPLTTLIDELESGFKKLLDTPDEKLKKNFYSVISTFGISPPAVKESVDNVIRSNISNTKWYIENNFENIALNILEYIAGYSLYSYGLNKSLSRILGIIIEILNQDFLNDIKYSKRYITNDILDREFIIKEIEDAIKIDLQEYPELKLNIESLIFNSKYTFIKSLLEEILKLSYN